MEEEYKLLLLFIGFILCALLFLLIGYIRYNLYKRMQLSSDCIMNLLRKAVRHIVRFCRSFRMDEELNKKAETTNYDARIKTILDAFFNDFQERWMRKLNESDAQMQKTVGALTISVQELKNELARFMVKVEQEAQKVQKPQPEEAQVVGPSVLSTLFAVDITDVGNGEYGFRVADLREKPTDCFFVLYLLTREHAEFRLSDNPRLRILLYTLLGESINKACSWAGDVPFCIDSIVNYAPGKLELQGNVWRIKEKVQIKFISKQDDN